MESDGQLFEVPRSEMAVVRVKRENHTLGGGIAGFLLSGVGWAAYLCHDGYCETSGFLLAFTLFGAPGGLVGALIGCRSGGDEEIIF